MTEPTEEQYRILLVFRTALRHFEQWSGQQAAELGLTSQQHQFLLAVRAHPGPNPPAISDLARYLLIRHHSAVELTNRVAALGLVTRFSDPSDRRRVLVRLTDQGRDVIDSLSETHMAELELVARRLNLSTEFLGHLAEEFGDFLATEGA